MQAGLALGLTVCQSQAMPGEQAFRLQSHVFITFYIDFFLSLRLYVNYSDCEVGIKQEGSN